MPKTSIKYPRRSRRLQSFQIKKSSTANSSNICTNQTPSPLQCILGDDIIGHILFGGYLDNTPKQTAILRGICHQFNSLTSTYCTTLDAKPSFLKKKVTLSTRTLSNIVRNFPSLTHVDVSHLGDAFTDKHMRLLSPSLVNIRVLKLRGTAVTNEGVMDSLGFTHSCRPRQFDNLPLEVLDLSKTCRKDRNKIGHMAIIAIGVSAMVILLKPQKISF